MQLPKKQFDLFVADLLANHIADVRQLLATNGFDTTGIADDDVKIAFLKAIKDSPSFRSSAANWMAQLAQWKANKNFTGEGYLNALTDTIDQSTIDQHVTQVTGQTNTSTSSTKSSFWQTLGGVANSENLNKLFGFGLDTLSTKLTANANKDSEERALELERLRLQQLQTQQAIQASGKGTSAASGLSTGAKVAIGLGAALLIGTFIYLAVKKK